MRPMELKPIAERFVLHWGEMGSRWGVNRTVAQVHALLYLAGRPMDAEEITETLGVARSNVSTSLKELQSWNLVHRGRAPDQAPSETVPPTRTAVGFARSLASGGKLCGDATVICLFDRNGLQTARCRPLPNNPPTAPQ